MADPNKQGFSYQIYSELDDAVNEAFDRQSTAPEAEDSDLAALVGNVLPVMPRSTSRPELQSLEPEVAEWANAELDKITKSWAKFQSFGNKNLIGTAQDVGDEIVKNPKIAGLLERLFDAKNAFEKNSEVTPSGVPLSLTMELVALPWGMFNDRFSPNFSTSRLADLREAQGFRMTDTIDSSVLNAFNNGKLRYLYDNLLPGTVDFSPQEYLQRRVETDGPWGIGLVQTSNNPGIRSLRELTPDELETMPLVARKIGDHVFTGMGIFEWLSFTLQYYSSKEDASELGRAWLPANRFTSGDMDCVVTAGQVNVNGNLDMGFKSASNSSSYPFRLAVL